MAYFLQRPRNKKGLCLQIGEKYWNPRCDYTVNGSVRTVVREHKLREFEIADPFTHLRAKVDAMKVGRRPSKGRRDPRGRFRARQRCPNTSRSRR